MQRVLLPALVAAAALVVVGSAFGATTTIGPYGTTMLDGRKVFPIVLAKGPERGAKTPTGADALDEVVGAGVNFLKVGPPTGRGPMPTPMTRSRGTGRPPSAAPIRGSTSRR